MGNEKYIHNDKVHNLNAPNEVVPILIELFDPASVLDVGCGIGTWLYKFQESGVGRVLGLDGDYVDRVQLGKYLSADQFMATDLSDRFALNERFDLVLSLEVAEHLPESSAQIFIESLVKHGDTIIFSAAIPHQGGQNHFNEQWKKYWVDQFSFFKYKVYDIMRPRIWNNDKIDWWYRQNMLVFSKNDLTHLIPRSGEVLDSIHPQLFQLHVDYIIYLQQYVNELEQKVLK